MACKFKPAYLLIAFQQQMTIITIHMSKNDGLEKKKKKSCPGQFILPPAQNFNKPAWTACPPPLGQG